MHGARTAELRASRATERAWSWPAALTLAWRGLLVVGLALAIVLSVRDLTGKPPGFAIDESSIAYNAFSIARYGHDEHGIAWPLYFKSFGEYKNPTYIYLLAGLFWLTGPSILVARLLSAVLILLAAGLLGLLGYRIARRWDVAALTAITAALTPWFFELGRLAYEVALFPLVLAAFLLVVHRAQTRATWWTEDSIAAGLALGLMTYTYSVGRLLAPALAVGLVLLAARARPRGIALTWAVYALTLLPMLAFQVLNPGALTARFGAVTYITPESSLVDIAVGFVTRYVANLSPWTLLVKGDPFEVHHVPGMGSIFVATFLLAVGGALLVLRDLRTDPWWRFVLYGLAVSVVPASLTVDTGHALRLIALPVFLLVLTVPAYRWLLAPGGLSAARRACFLVAIVALVVQTGVFQWKFDRFEGRRRYEFAVDYAHVFDRAVQRRERPIVLADTNPESTYIHGLWYGALRGLSPSEVRRLDPNLPPPSGSLVVGSVEACKGCKIVGLRKMFPGESLYYMAFVVP